MDTSELLVVIVYFRLGPFGFLNLGIEECPGNQGLWDQLLALEWVRDNIQAFGGDNSNVTLVGHGSGSICVSHHLVSPQTTGLFHRAILMSGTFISPYFWQNHDSKQIAHLFLEEMECKDFEALQSKSQSEILAKANFMGDLNDEVPNPWVPSVDKARCLKITGKVSFNNASEASNVYILRSQKFTKNAKQLSICRVLKAYTII